MAKQRPMTFQGLATATALACVVLTGGVQAAPFTEIRIGDVDGFGYGTGAGFFAANGGPANVDGLGVLQNGDFLPDLDPPGGAGRDGVVATGSRDDFDNRSGEVLGGSGYTDMGSQGTEYTDIALSTSYDTSSAANEVWNNNTATYGAGGLFPGDGNPNTLSNQPGFLFDFDVAMADIAAGSSLFFNVVFGDYDVSPATLDLHINDGSGGEGALITLPLTVQPNNQDGLIQSATTALNFNQVFSDDGGGNWNGFLRVDFVANSEPYTAFDYVELSLIPLQPVPEPATLGMLGLGLLAFGFKLARRESI